ncbi:MAG: class I SAM-dependent methyltransferase [Anaerolineae bacterium]
MDDYRAETFGERFADVYDDWFPDADERMIARLSELARGGTALELAIGSGRVALPLRQAGVAMQGIDISPEMVARLRARPGGDSIPVTIGDFADVGVDGEFPLIFVVFNTIFGLLSQDEQVRCFENVVRRLAPGGVFVIEAFVPDVARFTARQVVRVVKLELGAVHLNAGEWDPVRQHITIQHIVLTEAGVRLRPMKLRYAWPAELDLMARLAGLRLRERWADWDRAPFTADSTKHISLYERASP